MNASIIRLPLYKLNSSPGISNNANMGLLYDKFCDQWQADWRKGLRGDGKGKWINSFCGRPIGDPDLLKETEVRQSELLNVLGGHALLFKTRGPMISGLGRSHPVENGFAWHHLLGVPYLPGSSIKGMVRSYATNWLDGNTEMNKTEVKRIFGPRDGGIHVGSVIFIDAFPIIPVRLKAEIMTPHYAPYYHEGVEPPGDWFSPVPIPFLAVDEGGMFLFGILPRNKKRPKDNEDSNKASDWLVKALDKLGVGAKTSSGYGRFSRVELSGP